MIIPIILAGGYGKRLWPLSTKTMPKQFIKLNGNKSLFQHAVENALVVSNQYIVIICNNEHYNLVKSQLKNYDLKKIQILVEPISCNSFTAITISALKVFKEFKDAFVIILPADHYIENIEILKNEIEILYYIRSQKITIFGIPPKYAEVGYGYIKKGNKSFYKANLYQVAEFVEKPTLQIAEKYINDKNYLWNSGIIFCSCKVLINEIQVHANIFVKYANHALKESKSLQPNIVTFNEDEYKDIPNISIDYALLEKTKNIQVVELHLKWNDLGSWKNISKIHNHEDNNYLFGDVTMDNCKNTYLYAQSRRIIALGIENCIFVETDEAILIASKNKICEISNLKNTFDTKVKPYVQISNEHERPWGKYKVLNEEKYFKTKILTIKPGHKTSMQLHYKREEYWTIVSGLARLSINDSISEVGAGSQVHIPKNVKHRIENIGTIPLKIIEVQIGNYLAEDDIIRFDDDYGRVDISLQS
ncbi:MAG: mannose-1-phosphate guanylyltransferase/mannose-6-phosphate isomerase [Alphaproteobacteria bacterium]